MKTIGRVSPAVFLIGFFGLSALRAQNSQVSGRLVDPSHAAVSGARVSLTRVETGERREAISGEDGHYSFPLLLPGGYDLKVEKEGFETQTRTGIKVETGSASTVDVQLSVGAVSQAVTIEATVPLLQAESGAVAAVIQNQTIVNMPLIDRRSAQLTRLSGFVVQNG